jgi:hypothetical protein
MHYTVLTYHMTHDLLRLLSKFFEKEAQIRYRKEKEGKPWKERFFPCKYQCICFAAQRSFLPYFGSLKQEGVTTPKST